MLPRTSGAGNPPASDTDVHPGGVPDFWAFAVQSCESIMAEVEMGTRPEWMMAFDMARSVRGHPHAKRYKPLTVAKKVHANCIGLATLIEEEDFIAGFESAWKKVRLLPGTNPLESALRYATESPLGLRPEEEEDVTPGYKRFIALAGWLCVVVGSSTIKLPCREVAKVLGVRAMTVSHWRQKATEAGYLVVTKEHNYRANGKGEATEFRFPIEWYKCLSEKIPAAA